MEKNIAQYIEHTNAKPDATIDDIKKLCQEAIDNNFWAVCVNSNHVNTVYEMLKDTGIQIVQTVGFPFGCSTKKAYEISPHADEIDMVMNIGSFKSQRYNDVIEDIQRVRKAAGNKTLKVIIETALLTKEEVGKAAFLCEAGGADIIKTNTGFFKPRPRPLIEDVIAIKTYSPLPIKASGGIKTYKQVIELLRMGVARIGTSSGIEIIKGEMNEGR